MIAQRKNSYYQRQKDARIQQVMDTLVIDTVDDVTFARVPSTSKVGQMYVVTINENCKVPYAEKCTCPGKYEYCRVCIHMIGVNRFFERIQALLHPQGSYDAAGMYTPSEAEADADTAVRINEQNELTANDKTYAQAVQERAEEVGYIGDPRIETIEVHTHGYGCCGHIVKSEHDGQLCGACLCK